MSSGKKVYFTSDTHFGHANIIKYCHRPFLSELDKVELSKRGTWHDGSWKGTNASDWKITEEAIMMMDEELINQINSMVMANDILYHLGDFAMPGKHSYFSRCREYRSRIKCNNVILIWGNHDEPSLQDLFSATYDLKKISVDHLAYKIIACHYAMATWDGSHRRNVHLYGHSHSEAEAWLNRIMPGRRSMDVGVDNAFKLLGKFRPFSLDEIVEIFSTRAGHTVDGNRIDPNSPTEERLQAEAS
jgi:calcineurin-like phosphoesterase family protein